LDRLASKASNSVDINLDMTMLQLAARFLSGKDPDEARVRSWSARSRELPSSPSNSIAEVSTTPAISTNSSAVSFPGLDPNRRRQIAQRREFRHLSEVRERTDRRTGSDRRRAARAHHRQYPWYD
jgi:hypothetical protein